MGLCWLMGMLGERVKSVERVCESERVKSVVYWLGLCGSFRVSKW